MLEGADAVEAQKKTSEMSIDLAGAPSKLKMNEPKLKSAWESTPDLATA